ncbi:MAG: electron transfer flavoprotein subunit beta/FixA family protein [Candidatus Methylomirabilales bacterium]
MKMLVACKRVPDPSTKIRVKQDGSGIDAEGVKFVISALDEVAIEEGLKVKERRGGEVILFSLGPPQAEDQLRTGLAMGADRGILIAYEGFTDSDLVARALAAVFREERPDLILLGKVSPDTDAGQVGQLAAEYLALPQATFASKIDLQADDAKAVVTREVGGGHEQVEIQLPAVITCDFRLNTPRYASLPMIMKAKGKPVRKVSLEELGVEAIPKVKVLKLLAPAKRAEGVRVDSVEELLRRLREEAKVF